MTGQRVTSISLPNLAMERFQRAMSDQGNAPPDDIPLVLASEGPHGPVVHAANRAAQLTGIEEGGRVTDMRAFCPDLRVEYADVAGDVALMARLMLWSRRWCPWSVVDGPRGLILDTTGSDHLWGGEAAMLEDMEAQFSALGLSAQLAVAPTWGAAWGLARYGTGRVVCADPLRDMGGLPARALRLDAATLLLLGRLGLKTVGAIAAVPRATLARRFARAEFGANPLLRLDQALGRLAEPVSSIEERPYFRVQSRLSEPVQDPTPYLPELCAELCKVMAAENHGCRALHLAVYRSDGEVSHLHVATSQATREPGHLLTLFDDKLERINPGFGFDLITLEAPLAEPLQERQGWLDTRADDGVELARLIDRLSARLGRDAVTRPVLHESHMPERAVGWRGALSDTRELVRPQARERPLRLLRPPEEVRVLYAVPEGPPAQFVWRRQTHRVAKFAGPERIAPEWWQDRPGSRLRDYYKVEDAKGLRVWMYREGLHEDGRGQGDPRWFIHGLFA
ncbi:DNA polymerase Y family protein [uncultured Litoreibacter sp.]|uniref:Y-family DNA polymerase n=1 Tax=uncultured Litoreibacter sp. TaxID=1392394 RepID=UPI00261A8B50|nr:DNA polymerase Y family protein [uncultured Litoreibacter sp.]